MAQAEGDIDSVNHVGVAVRDMDQAVARYEALGFVLSPLSVHSGSAKPGAPVEPMATGNRCAIFRHNYVEVLGIVNPGRLDWSWGDFIKRFQGGHIICFGCKDAAVVDRRVRGQRHRDLRRDRSAARHRDPGRDADRAVRSAFTSTAPSRRKG